MIYRYCDFIFIPPNTKECRECHFVVNNVEEHQKVFKVCSTELGWGDKVTYLIKRYLKIKKQCGSCKRREQNLNAFELYIKSLPFQLQLMFWKLLKKK